MRRNIEIQSHQFKTISKEQEIRLLVTVWAFTRGARSSSNQKESTNIPHPKPPRIANQ